MVLSKAVRSVGLPIVVREGAVDLEALRRDRRAGRVEVRSDETPEIEVANGHCPDCDWPRTCKWARRCILEES